MSTGADHVTIRRATDADLDAVCELWCEMADLHAALDRRLWGRRADGGRVFGEWMAETLRCKDRALFVAELEGEVVGFAHGMLRGAPPPLAERLTGFISDAAVTEAHRGKGIGRKVSQALIDWFEREWAFSRVTFSTNEHDTRQIRLLEEAGLGLRYAGHLPESEAKFLVYG